MGLTRKRGNVVAKGKQKKSANRIILRRGLSIGELAAEDDFDFLRDAFVYLPILQDLLDLKSIRSIALGRTGTGKTALLDHVKKRERHVYQVKPKEVSLNYISNSTIIKFFSELGVDLDLFYQLLWRHVIAVELIRQRYDINSEAENQSFLSRIQIAIFGNERQRAAIDYLRNWQSKFWINWDERVKEITKKFEGELESAAESTVPGFKFSGEASAKLAREEKIQLSHRAQMVVNGVQIAELSKVIDLLADQAFGDSDEAHYLVIDDLDDRWVDENIRFKLIRALIETLKVFRKISNLKIIIALRADILERVYNETRDLGFQLDKYDGAMARLKWSERELKDLVNKRVTTLFKRQYTKDNTLFDDLFVYKVGNIDPFRYLIDRTLMRPRDIIAFVNECLAQSDGRTEVTAQIIRSAEQPYSLKRLIAVQDEWQSVHPNLSIGIQLFANKPELMTFGEIGTREVIEDISLKLSDTQVKSSDEIHQSAKAVFENANIGNVLRFAKLIVSTLYKVGLIGIKTEKNQSFNYCYLNNPTILEHQINDELRIRIHPMFWRALNTKV